MNMKLILSAAITPENSTDLAHNISKLILLADSHNVLIILYRDKQTAESLPVLELFLNDLPETRS